MSGNLLNLTARSLCKEHLIMFCVNILQIGAKGAELIAETLKYNNTISSLDLRGNGLKDEVRLSR